VFCLRGQKKKLTFLFCPVDPSLGLIFRMAGRPGELFLAWVVPTAVGPILQWKLVRVTVCGPGGTGMAWRNKLLVTSRNKVLRGGKAGRGLLVGPRRWGSMGHTMTSGEGFC
jgi:hypothetical protein